MTDRDAVIYLYRVNKALHRLRAQMLRLGLSAEHLTKREIEAAVRRTHGIRKMVWAFA